MRFSRRMVILPRAGKRIQADPLAAALNDVARDQVAALAQLTNAGGKAQASELVERIQRGKAAASRQVVQDGIGLGHGYSVVGGRVCCDAAPVVNPAR
jgi:hypothetical protein